MKYKGIDTREVAKIAHFAHKLNVNEETSRIIIDTLFDLARDFYFIYQEVEDTVAENFGIMENGAGVKVEESLVPLFTKVLVVKRVREEYQLNFQGSNDLEVFDLLEGIVEKWNDDEPFERLATVVYCLRAIPLESGTLS